MKAVLEFGIRGDSHVDNKTSLYPIWFLTIVIPSAKLASKVARMIVSVLREEEEPATFWKLNKKSPRISWSSSTHFVAVSLLDGKDRGPASTKLWRKPKGGE